MEMEKKNEKIKIIKRFLPMCGRMEMLEKY